LEDAPQAPLSDFIADWQTRLPDWKEADVAALAAAYGRALPELLKQLPPAASPPGPDVLETARFAYAAAEEMAVTPGDLARRLARWYSIQRPGVVERASEWLAGRSNLTHGNGQGGA
jgi:hypothetical protein